MKLYTKISIGLVAGATAGIVVNIAGWEGGGNVLATIEPFGLGWIRLIRMIVVPLVVASLVVGAASLGDLRTLGRVGGKTVAYYLATTSVAVSIGLVLSNVIKPGRGLSVESQQALQAEYGTQAAGNIELGNQAPSVVQLLLSMIPDNPVGAAANADMLPLILFSILFGVAATMIREDRRRAVLGVFEAINDISMVMIHWVMTLAPYAVFVLIAAVTARFGFEILESLLWYTGTVVLGLALHAFGTFSLILRFLARVNPVEFFRRIRNAQLLGFSTSSSSATLPVSMQIAEENLGISKKISSFVLPLGATVNMDGTALYQGVAVMFIAQVFGIELSVMQQLMVVLTATLASIGAAGVPSAGIITLTIVLSQAGVPDTGIALILGVDRILDMLRTSVNLTGDLTGATFIARTEGENIVLDATTAPTVAEGSPAQ
ncbi:MAG: dicarboxylate/amino acid:cation symporter [Gemmatimonadetes bacterium]|nr:dicarboxylate/amino acid:cation symporter [Gemmatimonadota bacterium]